MKRVILSLILLSSCSTLFTSNKELKSYSQQFNQAEEAGVFRTFRKSGFDKAGNYVVKQNITSQADPTKSYEKSVSILSKIITDKIEILMAKKSEFSVILNGKKYTTNHTYDYKSKKLTVKMESPEKQWNGVKEFTLPKGNGAVCFYSAVIECAVVAGFVEKAKKYSGGKMNFTLIWEGYPYFQEQFLNIPPTPFVEASLSYDGMNNEKQIRFSLNAGGQSQFIFIDSKNKIIKHLWPSQGFTKELAN